VSPTAATFLFEAANFLVLAAALGWFFFRPVQNALENRRAELEAERRQAADHLTEADRRLAEIEAQRRQFTASLDSLRVQAQEQAEREAERIMDGARAEGRHERERMKTELAALRRAHAKTAARDAAAAAREIVVRLLAHIGGPDLEPALVRAACRELRALAGRARLAPALVEASQPLLDQTRALLAEALDCQPSEVRDRVVPELVGGVRVITSAGLVDASVAGLAAFAERALLARIDREEDSGV
jgi:F0F1-type ATP synthase membrane subunit b/b'